MLISPEEAWNRLDPHLRPLSAETLPRRRAEGRVLAEALAATVDVPAADVSAMDGYALAGEGGEEPRRLPVTGMIAAGDPPGARLEGGQAVRIMTGAPVPAGADRVVPVEQTNDSDEEVEVSPWPAEGAHIRRRGEVLEAGAPLLEAGALLTPGALALLATHGYGKVSVHRRPTMAILVTGDEVVPPSQVPKPGQLRDSHTPFLLAAADTLGIEAEPLGIAPDEEGPLREMVQEGLKRDVFLVTGGISMGELDFVGKVLGELGCKALFEKLAVQPAKPLVAAVHEGGLVFALPGNPASAMVAFWLFVRPALRRLLGSQDHYWQGALAATLEAPLRGAKGRDRFLPARVRFQEGKILATPLHPRGSHDVAAYAAGTALLKIPAHSAPREAGEACEVLPLADWRVG